MAVLPKAGHDEELPVGPSKQVGLVDAPFLPPFEEPIRRDETSAVAKGITEQGGALGRLRTGVDREPSPEATHAPERVGQDGLAALEVNYGALLTWSDVVSRPKLDPRLAEGVER
jgi:hypothetical protein